MLLQNQRNFHAARPPIHSKYIEKFEKDQPLMRNISSEFKNISKPQENNCTVEHSCEIENLLLTAILTATITSYYYYTQAFEKNYSFNGDKNNTRRLLLQNKKEYLDSSYLKKNPKVENEDGTDDNSTNSPKSVTEFMEEPIPNQDELSGETKEYKHMELNTSKITSFEESLELLRRTRAITAMSNRLMLAKNEMKCYEEVSSLLVTLFKVEMCSFILMTDSTNFTVLHCHIKGLPNEIELVESGLSVPLKGTGIEYCASTHETLYTPCAKKNPYMNQEKAVTDGLNSFLNTPIFVAGRKFAGCINLASSKENDFTENDIALIQEIATTLGTHIYSKRLLCAEQESHRVSKDLLHSLIPPEVCSEIEHYWSAEKNERSFNMFNMQKQAAKNGDDIEIKERFEDIKDQLELFESLNYDRSSEFDNPGLNFSASNTSLQLYESKFLGTCDYEEKNIFNPEFDPIYQADSPIYSDVIDEKDDMDDSISLDAFNNYQINENQNSLENEQSLSLGEGGLNENFYSVQLDESNYPLVFSNSLGSFEENSNLQAQVLNTDATEVQPSQQVGLNDSIFLGKVAINEPNKTDCMENSIDLMTIGNDLKDEKIKQEKRLDNSLFNQSFTEQIPSDEENKCNDTMVMHNRIGPSILEGTKNIGSTRTIKSGSKKGRLHEHNNSEILNQSLNLADFQSTKARKRVNKNHNSKRYQKQYEEKKRYQENRGNLYLFESLGHDRFNFSTCFTNLKVNTKPKQLSTSTSRALFAEEASNVSIIFTDIVGFSRISMEVKPIKVMDMLQDLFSRFDALCSKHGIFKIETVGDAYVCAAGIFDDSSTTKNDKGRMAAKRALAMAKDMVREARKVIAPSCSDSSLTEFLQIRAGIHTGDVTYGVLGKNTPRLALFGNAVNMAARMEQTSVPNKIHATKAFHDLIGNEETNWEQSRFVSVKNMGKVEAYLLDPIKIRQKRNSWMAECA